jgi:hypothetical protein
MEVLPAGTAGYLHHCVMYTDRNFVSTVLRGNCDSKYSYCRTVYHSVMDTWIECSVFSTGYRENGGSACRYCRTVTSQCYGYID